MDSYLAAMAPRTGGIESDRFEMRLVEAKNIHDAVSQAKLLAGSFDMDLRFLLEAVWVEPMLAPGHVVIGA